MPGINALIARRTRPDLVRDAPWSSALPWLGLVWLVFTLLLYWFAGIAPILNTLGSLSDESALSYFNRSGVSFVLLVVIVGIVWYVIQALRNRARGVETQLMYQMIPPD